MVSEVQKNYYAIIPANVRYDKDITPNAKLLYGEITALCNEKGYCWASNTYFSELFKTNVSSVYKWMTSLENKKLIETYRNKFIVNDLKNKNLHGFGYGSKICEWCGISTSVLHKHHHPIPKSRGGIKTVGICPNCHHEFHYHEKFIRILLKENELKELIKARDEANGKSV